ERIRPRVTDEDVISLVARWHACRVNVGAVGPVAARLYHALRAVKGKCAPSIVIRCSLRKRMLAKAGSRAAHRRSKARVPVSWPSLSASFCLTVSYLVERRTRSVPRTQRNFAHFARPLPRRPETSSWPCRGYRPPHRSGRWIGLKEMRVSAQPGNQ